MISGARMVKTLHPVQMMICTLEDLQQITSEKSKWLYIQHSDLWASSLLLISWWFGVTFCEDHLLLLNLNTWLPTNDDLYPLSLNFFTTFNETNILKVYNTQIIRVLIRLFLICLAGYLCWPFIKIMPRRGILCIHMYTDVLNYHPSYLYYNS